MRFCDFFPYLSGLGTFFPWGVLHLLVWGVFILLVIWLAVKLFGALTTGRARGKRDKADSLDILNLRFARGEIGREDYLKMRELLKQSP